MTTVRAPAVAGTFYPADSDRLQRLVDDKRDVSAFGSRMLDGGVDLKALAQGNLP